MERTNITPVEKWIVLPVSEFISKSTTSGVVLFVAAMIAIFMANSPWAHWYHSLWENKFGFGWNSELFMNFTLHHWINDGLMAIFFFVVGLELKREITGGELSSPKKAMLPIIAALGGMLFPALIYLVFNGGGEASHGWGIPMATDIAFALGVLYLLGNKVPVSLKVFLTALAIADDLGAVLVIALFYTSDISLFNLGIGFLFFAVLILANYLGVKNTLFYVVVGIGGIWTAFLMSGVHATIAAVLAAFTIPSTARVDEWYFTKKMNYLRDKFLKIDAGKNEKDLAPEQIRIMEKLQKLTKDAIPPSQRLEHGLHSFVAFVVMPIFALANAAIPISFGNESGGVSSVTIGVALGLLVGKVIGVTGLTALIIRLKWADYPKGMNFKNLLGVGFLASIGFTMSLFVTELAFDADRHPDYPNEAKMGILIASLVGGMIGFFLLNKKR